MPESPAPAMSLQDSEIPPLPGDVSHDAGIAQQISPQMPEPPAPAMPMQDSEIPPLPGDVSHDAGIAQQISPQMPEPPAPAMPMQDSEIPPLSGDVSHDAGIAQQISPQMPEPPAPAMSMQASETPSLPGDVSHDTGIAQQISPQMPESPDPAMSMQASETPPLPGDVSHAAGIAQEVVQPTAISPAEVPPASVTPDVAAPIVSPEMSSQMPEAPTPNMPLQNDPAIGLVDEPPQSSVNTLETSDRVPQYMIDELDHSIKNTIAAVCALDLDKSIILQISGAVNQLHRSGNIEHFIAIVQLVAAKHKNDISPNVFELLQQHIHTLSKPYEEDKSLLLSLGSRNEVFNNIVVAIQNREFGLIAKIICSMDYDDNRKEMIALLKKEMAEQDFNQVNILIEQHDNTASQSSSGTLWNRIKGFVMSKKRSN